MGKIAFLFPGQGAQYVGMARELIETQPVARDLFARASEILEYDLARLCTAGPKDELDTTVVSQPAIFVASLAALEQLRSQRPDLVRDCQAAAGLSLGEYTALVFAGVLDFEAGLRIVAARGAAMQDAADLEKSGMVSILGLDIDKVAALCDEARQESTLEIANYLCPGNIVVSGAAAACERVADLAATAGAMKVVPLAVAGAFHTPIMQPAVDRLATAIAEAQFSRARIPVVSNVDAELHVEAEDFRRLLIRQIVSPVRWEESMRRLLADDYDQFWEIGPGRVLRGLLKRVDRKAVCAGVME